MGCIMGDSMTEWRDLPSRFLKENQPPTRPFLPGKAAEIDLAEAFAA